MKLVALLGIYSPEFANGQSGIIMRFAGNNTSGFSGDGGLARSAELNVTLLPKGAYYVHFSGIGGNVVRKFIKI